MTIHLPGNICRNLDLALQREWLVTNGLGGFAAGTVAGALTRRYHGVLIAALRPPVGRTLLVAKLDDALGTNGQRAQLYTNIWRSGVEQPAGVQYLSRFDVRLGVPTWTFDVGAARLVKRIWMEPGQNVTYVQYELPAAAGECTLLVRVLVNDRHYHYLRHETEAGFDVHVDADGLQVSPPTAVGRVRVWAAGVERAAVRWEALYTWCHGFSLPVERDRGFDHEESHLVVALAHVNLRVGDCVTFAVSATDEVPAVEEARSRFESRQQARLSAASLCPGATGKSARVPVQQSILAADQFIVARPTPAAPDGHTIIAGYPWFTDWGRDTMIALPGLTLVTGRHDVARQILRTWGHYVDQGMVPNRFPDESDTPEYHTADATLWYLWAIDQYVRATHDVKTLAELFPVMRAIVDWHRRGTRHNIGVGDDGLVHAGELGINLTWMDAKVGDRVITPRHGKPIELSALWYDGLCNLARLADLLDEPGDEYARMAEKSRAAFGRFWNGQRGFCFDVLDGPQGSDAALRPNQIFAVSLAHSALPRAQQEAVVECVGRELLTWHGLRSLARGESGYRGQYVGGPVARDEAYHQGTVWGWLLGPYVIAHYRLHRDAAAARQLLAPMFGHLWTGGVGSLSEIFDGEEPFMPQGCPAQAWSVAETLRAWWVTQGAG